LLHVPLHDYGCTLKAYRREVVEDVRLYGEMHRFIPIYAAWEGARVTELAVTHHPRRYGRSKYGIGRVFRVLLDLLIVYFIDRAFDRPIQFFGKLGVAFLLPTPARAPWPDLFRPPTSSPNTPPIRKKAWMAGTSPAKGLKCVGSASRSGNVRHSGVYRTRPRGQRGTRRDEPGVGASRAR